MLAGRARGMPGPVTISGRSGDPCIGLDEPFDRALWSMLRPTLDIRPRSRADKSSRSGTIKRPHEHERRQEGDWRLQVRGSVG